MFGRRLGTVGMVVVGVMLLVAFAAIGADGPLTSEEELGKSIFFDQALSLNRSQSCASCHDPDVGFTGPDSATNAGSAVYEGSFAGRFGDRKPPSAAYATQSPLFHLDKHGTFSGGNFWDGRATGEVLGNPAADQAQGPFLNPNEQALSDSACVVYRVCNANAEDYPVSCEDVRGEGSCDITWPGNVETDCGLEGTTVSLSPEDRKTSNTAYDNIVLSIAAYEASPEVNAFSSKLDMKDKLSKEEQRGKALFVGKGKCAACHPSNGPQPLFTDFTFDNLGVPPNPANPALMAGPEFVDPALGGFLMNAGYDTDVDEEEWGKHKVPTLRNVDQGADAFVKAYTHNGYFKTLEGTVHFYNTRDVLPECPGTGTDTYAEAEALKYGCWPAPEVAENVNTDELGGLGLSPDDEAAIVAFLKALSDGHTP